MSSHTITNIRKAGGLVLTKRVTKNGKKKFIITTDVLFTVFTVYNYRDIQKLSAILDPFNNRRMGAYPQWKFRNLKEAEEHMSLAILKGWNK